MDSSKPNRNNNNNNGWFMGEPERKKPRLNENFENIDDDDDALFAGDAMEEIEIFATQMESQMENEEPRGFFEQYAVNGGDMYNIKEDKTLKKQMEELKESNEQKSGETILLREKLAEMERVLQKEREEKYELEKAKRKVEEKFKADILKTKEKYEDQIGFSRQELDEANSRIKTLENKNKMLQSEMEAGNEEESQKNSTPNITSKRIKFVKVKSPRSHGSARPSIDNPSILATAEIETPRYDEECDSDGDPPSAWWIKHFGKTKAEKHEEVTSFWEGLRLDSQKTSYSRQGAFRQICEQLQCQYPEERHEEFYKKIVEAKGASGDLLRTINKETYTDEYKLMLAIPFFEFFPLYVDKCCSGYLSPMEKKNLHNVLSQLIQTCEDCPKVREHVLKNMQPALDALYDVCRNDDTKIVDYALSTLAHLFFKTADKYRTKLVPFLSTSKPPFSLHFVRICIFVVADRKALVQLIRPEPEPPVPKLWDDEEDDQKPPPDFLQQLQDTYDYSQEPGMDEEYKDTCRVICSQFMTNITWYHSAIFFDYPELVGKVQTFINHIMRTEIELDRRTFGGLKRHRIYPLWNMVHSALPVFNSCLPKQLRYCNIDPGYLFDIHQRLCEMEKPDQFVIESREILKDQLQNWKR